MKTRTVTESVGENMGPIDWSYDFLSHFDTLCANDAGKLRECEMAKERLRQIEQAFKAGKPIRATVYGGWPRCGLNVVVDVGMYDGWPFWRPVPSVQTKSWLGCEWHGFSFITDIADESGAIIPVHKIVDSVRQ